MDSPPFTVLSLCSGGGGFDLGLELAVPTARVVCWVEWDAFAASVLVQAMEENALAPAPLWTDLRTFDGKPWRGAVDCIVAGFPCPPYSTAGQKRGKDDDRDLWPDVYRVVQEVRPPIVFLENVGGATGHPDGLRRFLGDLEAADYRATATLVRASDVGAPHQRERVFILGVEDSSHTGGRSVGQRHGSGAIGAPEADRAVADTRRSGDERRHAQGESRCTGSQGGQETRKRITANAGVQGNAMDDAAGPRRERGRSEPSRPIRDEARRGEPGGRCDAVENTRRTGTGRDTEPSGVNRGGPSSHDSRASGTLADSDGRRLDRCEESYERSATEQPTPRRHDTERPYPLFPPGPGDLDAWKRILEHDPSLAPALEPPFRELADGLAADRRQWLRLLGNGVVPLQSAYAFCALATSLFGESR